jgi:hypothetical protein
MKGKKVLVLLVPVLVLSMLLAIPAAIAIGPEHAVEVGNNPNLSSPRGNPVLDTPSGVHNVWTSVFNHWIDASKGGGKMNNAVIVGPTADVTLAYLLTHLSEYENTWIYFSQTAFKYFLIYAQGMTAEEAGAAADLYPYGIYWQYVTVG